MPFPLDFASFTLLALSSLISGYCWSFVNNFVYTCVQILHFHSNPVSVLGMSECNSQMLQNIKMHRAKMQKQNKQRTSTSPVPRWLTNDVIARPYLLFPLKSSGKWAQLAKRERMRRTGATRKNEKQERRTNLKAGASRPK